MKTIILSLAILVLGFTAKAQSGSAKQVNWVFAAKKVSGNSWEITMTATINGNYHMYAQKAGTEGPVPTSFEFNANPLLVLKGGVKESGSIIRKFEKAWDSDVNYFEKKAVFTQKVEIKGKVKTSLNGIVTFMVCNDNQCLPPSDVSFKVPVGG
ncbi:MAG: protein-disulfide reductase DsbD domain-containing protein [Chitinophagaceae bacterium]